MSAKEFLGNGIRYTIRSAIINDAQELSELRVQIDGETENLDREKGEDYLDPQAFEQVIVRDTEGKRNLFLVAEVDHRIVGFSRCQGNELKRFSHQAEFGVCVLKEFWGHGIGKKLLKETISWSESADIKKLTLKVLETNEKAIQLYERNGFETEGVLKKDKILSDGKYYNTVLMARFKG
ncbi:GNAT family N-acetyltransferase [Heyndrickxia acidicola]|uniref:GNAT family N-acetyltransferase n=1 Tax=Heyndrickxia acidicola TaxID=209389 RepID=A0ABU6MN77_9BACI|nr:GNAT family N-acetyltransferase [Heyndrickxia acidicola]MED1205769.1 GNAT family N-acetyltransferase [Heyndrickxia acidicola]